MGIEQRVDRCATTALTMYKDIYTTYRNNMKIIKMCNLTAATACMPAKRILAASLRAFATDLDASPKGCNQRKNKN